MKPTKNFYKTNNLKENFRNDNIYKQDDYKMKLSLSFSEPDETRCKKSIFSRHIMVVKYCSLLTFLKYIYKIISTAYDNTTSDIILIMIGIFCLLLAWLLLNNLGRFISFIKLIRLLLEISDNLLFTLTVLNQKDTSKVFSFSIMFVKYFTCCVYNFCFSLNLYSSIIYYVAKSLLILSFGKPYEKHLIVRLFYNIFSLNFFYVFGTAFLIFIIQMNYTKILREFWVLYDSFKKSYNTINSIFEDLPHPVLIIKQKDFAIFFKNSAADKFLKKHRAQNNKNKEKFDKDPELKDIINIKAFEKEINNCINKKVPSFDFPIAQNFKDYRRIENENFPALYEGNVIECDWVKVYVYQCDWKQHEKEALVIQVMDRSSMHKNNLYELEMFKKINDEMKEICNNYKEICYNAPHPNNIKNGKASNFASSKQRAIKERFAPLNLNNDNKFKFDEKDERAQKGRDYWQSLFPNNDINFDRKKEKIITDNKDAASTPMIQSTTKKRKNINQSDKLTESKLPKTIECYYDKLMNNYCDMQIYKTYYDPTLLYFMDYNVNYIYDMYLSLSVFNTLKNNKWFPEKKNIDITSFFNYFLNYIEPFAESKGFQIELKKNEITNPVVGLHYIYFRVLLFNMLMFIFDNVNDENETKELNIKIEHSRFGEPEIYKMVFIYTEIKSLINFNKLNTIIQGLKDYDIKDIDISSYKSLNFSIILCYYICNSVFFDPKKENDQNGLLFKELNGKQKRITASFFIYSEGEDNKSKEFKNFKCELSKKGCNSILAKIYKKKREDKGDKKTIDLDYGDEDPFKPEEEDKITIEKDLETKREIRYVLNKEVFSKILSKAKKLYYNKEEITKYENEYKIENDVDSIKSSKTEQNNKEKKAIKFKKFENTKLANNLTNGEGHRDDNVDFKNKTIKFFEFNKEILCFDVPRFLFLEDNLSRPRLSHRLKKFEFKFHVDLSIGGDDCEIKCESLFNKGFKYDGIIVDINLFGKKGIENIKNIRNKEKKYPEIHTMIITICNNIDKDLIKNKIIDKNFAAIKDNNEDEFLNYIHNQIKMFRPEIIKK